MVKKNPENINVNVYDYDDKSFNRSLTTPIDISAMCWDEVQLHQYPGLDRTYHAHHFIFSFTYLIFCLFRVVD